MMFPGRGDPQPGEPDGRAYSRSNASARPRPAEARNISNHPVISILLRIDELKNREETGHGSKQQGDPALAELEACLAAIQRGAR
jgi:hypothetical protein